MSMKRGLKRLSEIVLAPLAPLVWRRRTGPQLLVLMYHRVLPPEHPDRATEQPGMYVSPATLGMHLAILKRHFPLVHLDDWVNSARAGKPVPPQACALTFDDGWRDNFEYAFPILYAHEAPATIYLLSDLVGSHYRFWPNALATLLSDGSGGEAFSRWPEALKREVIAVIGSRSSPLPLLVGEIDAVITRCKFAYSDPELRAMLEKANGEAGARQDTALRDLMNWDEIRQMAASGLIRFGSHTRTHMRLGTRVSRDTLRDEICESRSIIEHALGADVSSFCYPNGEFCSEAVDIVRNAYTTAVTTNHGWNGTQLDPHMIRRVGVHEDIGCRPESFLTRLIF
jgi:peptidoglycan/xylan/chitin deacetylase (PgdA/CDA1 family)